MPPARWLHIAHLNAKKLTGKKVTVSRYSISCNLVSIILQVQVHHLNLFLQFYLPKQCTEVVCSQLNKEAEMEGKEIIEKLERGDASSWLTLQRSDVIYTMAKKNGLFLLMERMFQMEVEGQTSRGCFSNTQEIIVNIFKGNREVFDRFTCACSVRSKEYILSSPTAWCNLMDGMLYLAKSLTREEYQVRNMNVQIEREVSLLHRAARDAFSTINLALIHKKVAMALFFRGKATGKRSQAEARAYALDTLAAKLKVFFRNGRCFVCVDINTSCVTFSFLSFLRRRRICT